MRVNRLTDIHRISAHLYRQCNFTDHVARMRADDDATQNLAIHVDEAAIGHINTGFVGSNFFAIRRAARVYTTPSLNESGIKPRTR